MCLTFIFHVVYSVYVAVLTMHSVDISSYRVGDAVYFRSFVVFSDGMDITVSVSLRNSSGGDARASQVGDLVDYILAFSPPRELPVI